MQALGLVETYGLVAAIEAADVMLKTAQVKLVGYTKVEAGMIAVSVVGEVSAVAASVDAAASAVKNFGPGALISRHVIPRPHEEMETIVTQVSAPVAPPAEVPPMQSDSVAPAFQENTEDALPVVQFSQLNQAGVEQCLQEKGWKATLEALQSLSVIKLRNLARTYPDLGISGRAVSKANKELLLQKLEAYYQKKG